MKKLEDPTSEERLRSQRFRESYGSKGVLEVFKSMDHPLDSWIGTHKLCGGQPLEPFLVDLLYSTVFVLSSPENPGYVFKQTKELDLASVPEDNLPRIWVFTRERHTAGVLIRDEIADSGLVPQAIPFLDILETLPLGENFSISINPRSGGSPFSIIIPPDLCTLLMSMYRQDGSRRKKESKSHLAILFSVMFADGREDEREFELMMRIAEEEGLSRSDVEEVIGKLDDRYGELAIPESWYVRTLHLCNCVRLMAVDGDIAEEEIRFVEKVAKVFQFPSARVPELVRAFIECSQGKRELGFLIGEVAEWGRSGFTRSHWDQLVSE